MKKWIQLLRVHHYMKNLLVFLPLVFSGSLFDIGYLRISILSFVNFCFASSLVYIVNDFNDIEKDRRHPKKKNRPMASGAVSKKQAIIVMLILSIALLFFGIVINNMAAETCVVVYICLNILYSCKFKAVPIVDIVILVSGFFIRVLYGAMITGIPISHWLFLTVIAGSFYLGLGKRRNEIKGSEDGSTREVLKFYNYQFLDKNMYMCMALTNVFYALWAADYKEKTMIWTVPLVILICMKYSLVLEGDSDGDPIEVILHDKFLLVLGCIYILMVTIILYL